MAQAVGMIEVYGVVAAFAACDAGCKAANVTVEPFDKNTPANPDGLPVPLQILVKFRGSVENVTAAVEAAEAAANAVSGVVTKHVIPAMEDSSEAMLHINAFDKN